MSETTSQSDRQPGVACAEDMPCSFAQFVVSIGSSALVHLGEVPDPTEGRTRPDLKLARHSINVLAMLEAKTKGNLDDDEARLLSALLAELNQKYQAVRTR